MTGNKKSLFNFKRINGSSVTFGDNSYVVTRGVGTIFRKNIEIKDVSYIKGLKFNLLSIS